jgi:hypothetical protein
MSRSSTPASGRKDIFGSRAGAVISPSSPPAEGARNTRAAERLRSKEAAQALPLPARSLPLSADAPAGAVPKASPAKGDRPREPVAPSTAVPAPRGKITQVKPWVDKRPHSEAAPAPKAPKSVGWQTVPYRSKERAQSAVESEESERVNAVESPENSGSDAASDVVETDSSATSPSSASAKSAPAKRSAASKKRKTASAKSSTAGKTAPVKKHKATSSKTPTAANNDGAIFRAAQ